MDKADTPPHGGVNPAMVVAASSAGTAFEWYDFFVFGTLASIISARFTSGSASAGFIFTLGAFAAGFIVRPFGALVFGYIGDRFGRKRAFIQTILLMGASTMVILLQSQILFATLLGWLILKETIHWRTATGLSVGFMGLLFTLGAPDLQHNPWGFGIAMLSTVFLAFSYIRMRQLKDVHPMTFIGITNGFAVPFILAASLLMSAEGWTHLADADWVRVGGVLGYQLVLVSLSHIIWQSLLSRNPVATVASFVLLMPIIAIFLSGIMLGETMNPALAWGGTLTLAGVGIITIRKIQKHMPLPADPAVLPAAG